MKCLYCKGEMKKGTPPSHIDRKGCHVTLDSVPAWVCSQCGVSYFEAAEVDAIQDIIHSVEKKQRHRAGCVIYQATFTRIQKQWGERINSRPDPSFRSDLTLAFARHHAGWVTARETAPNPTYMSTHVS